MTSESLIGTRIGNIRIEALIGVGGMGKVFRGLDEKLERRVAIKTLRDQRRLSPWSKARFLREAKLLSKLDHPGICRVYDLVEDHETDYLIFEYIEGETLQRERLPRLEDQLRVMEQVAEALAAAHREGIVHRDLKPDNIMITRGNPPRGVKILDFGIARQAREREPDTGRESFDAAPAPPLKPSQASGPGTRVLSRAGDGIETPGDGTPFNSSPGADEAPPEGHLDPTLVLAARPAALQEPPEEPVADIEELATSPNLTEDGVVVGTVHYMSPEQARAERAVPAADLYSFGIVLQELVTGRHAYGEGVDGKELLGRVAQAETCAVADIDLHVAQLIEDLTAYDPRTRPSAGETAERIRWVLQRPARARRRRSWALAIGAGVLMMACAVALTAHLTRPRPLLAPDQLGRVVLLPFVNATDDPGLDWVEHGLMEMVAQSLHETEGIEVVPPERVDDVLERLEIDPDAELSVERGVELASAVKAELVIATSVSMENDRYALEYTSLNINGSTGARRIVADSPTEGASELGMKLAGRLNPDAVWIEIEDRYSNDPLANQLYAMGRQRMVTDGAQSAQPYLQVCLDRDPDFAMAALQMARVEEYLGHTEAAREMVIDIVDRARRREEPQLELSALLELSNIEQNVLHHEESTSLAQQALALAEEYSDREAEARALELLGVSYRGAYRLSEAEHALSRCRELATELGDAPRSASATLNLGTVLAYRNQPDQARDLLEEALVAYEELGATNQVAQSHYWLGGVAWSQSDAESALFHYHRALQMYRDSGWRSNEATALLDLGRVHTDLGQYEDAQRYLLQAAEIYRADEEAEQLARCLVHLAELRCRQGQLDEAEQTLQEAGDVPPASLRGTYVTAHLAYLRGEFRRAVELTERVKETVGESWDEKDEARLQVFHRAVRDGRRYPLSYESE